MFCVWRKFADAVNYNHKTISTFWHWWTYKNRFIFLLCFAFGCSSCEWAPFSVLRLFYGNLHKIFYYFDGLFASSSFSSYFFYCVRHFFLVYFNSSPKIWDIVMSLLISCYTHYILERWLETKRENLVAFNLGIVHCNNILFHLVYCVRHVCISLSFFWNLINPASEKTEL